MKNKSGGVLSSLILIALGVFLILNPATTVNTVVKIVGIGILVAGAFGVWGFIFGGEFRSVPSLVAAGVELIVGFTMFTNPSSVASFFPLVAGAVLAVSGVSTFLDSIKRRSGTSSAWKVSMLLSLVTILLGLVIFFNPFSTITLLLRVIGISFLYNGIVGMLAALKV